MISVTQQEINMMKYYEPIYENYGFGTGNEPMFVGAGIVIIWAVVVMVGAILLPMM